MTARSVSPLKSGVTKHGVGPGIVRYIIGCHLLAREGVLHHQFQPKRPVVGAPPTAPSASGFHATGRMKVRSAGSDSVNVRLNDTPVPIIYCPTTPPRRRRGSWPESTCAKASEPIVRPEDVGQREIHHAGLALGAGMVDDACHAVGYAGVG